MAIDPRKVAETVVSAQWAAQVRLEVNAKVAGTWDASLVRKPRVLVPIDVQALYVPSGSQELFVQLPGAIAGAGQDLPASPPVFAPGAIRPAGVHLHWAVPDALLRGELTEVPSASQNRLKMPPLPDRWIVTRLLGPRGSTTPSVRSWVIDAALAKAVPLEQWPAGAEDAPATGRPLDSSELTGTAGATSWTALYDASHNRLAFHDPLDDLAKVAPNGAHDDLAAYVVCGFWSRPELDPLDSAQTKQALHQRLAALGFSLMEDAEGGASLEAAASKHIEELGRVGLEGGQRYARMAEQTVLVEAPDEALPFVGLRRTEVSREYAPTTALFADEAERVAPAAPKWPRQSLLHGVIYGVPVRGPVVADQRPSADSVRLAVAQHTEDLAAALGHGALVSSASSEPLEAQRNAERLVSAFSAQLLPRLGTDDGLLDVEEHEHRAGFCARPGGEGAVDRLRPAGEGTPFPAGRHARAAAGAKGKKKGRKQAVVARWTGRKRSDLLVSKGDESLRVQMEEWEKPRTKSAGASPSTAPAPEARQVARPAPRFFEPLDPQVAIGEPKRHLRHHGDGRFSPDGLLHCRWPSQVPTAIAGLLDGAELVPSLPSGALPSEVLTLVRGALIQDPYLVPWLVEAGRRGRGRIDTGQAQNRLQAEAALRFGGDGVYDGGSRAFAFDKADRPLQLLLADELRRFSLLGGVDADPVGVTAWSQPWLPVLLEWEVEHQSHDRLDDWTLGPVDLEPPAEESATLRTRNLQGRSVLHTGTARTLASAMQQWLVAEDQRDHAGTGEVDEATEAALTNVADALEHLDMLTASLDGIRDTLLGLPVGEFGVVRPRNTDGTLAQPSPIDVPQLLVTGALRLRRLRLVDTFGRTLELPVDAVRVPARASIPSVPGLLRLRPRLQRPSRWLFRFVDAADLTTESREAFVDQVTPAAMVNPVAGFLLPDHIDEALEAFTTQGLPLGQLMMEPFGGGVAWEIAPGRSGPADAGPLHDLDPAQQLIGRIAAGLVAADADARAGLPANAASESALSAFLRAIDTTLWTVDTFAGFGSEHIAGLVGRPIAVVRAVLRFDLDDDLDELDLSAQGARSQREGTYRALADRKFPVRLGEITRADDGLLGFFVDDDYSRFHVVDKVVRDGALESASGSGHFQELGAVRELPAPRPILHPYVVADDELHLHPGQTRRLTLLMHPAGKVHLTSGILPRKNLALARDWVSSGLAVIAPSMRVGPVLVGPGEVHLPKISSFPKEQLWTRRTDPFTWKDDPILAATQTALLPDMPAEVQEGYIRIGSIDDVAPDDDPSAGGTRP